MSQPSVPCKGNTQQPNVKCWANMSAWRIEIRTGFYHRAKKTRPIKGLKLNPAVWRWWVLLAQCETLGENLSKTGTTRKSCPLSLIINASIWARHSSPLRISLPVFYDCYCVRCTIFSSETQEVETRGKIAGFNQYLVTSHTATTYYNTLCIQ